MLAQGLSPHTHTHKNTIPFVLQHVPVWRENYLCVPFIEHPLYVKLCTKTRDPEFNLKSHFTCLF